MLIAEEEDRIMDVIISEGMYKGLRSIEMETGRLKSIFMPVGSRMVSLYDKVTGREFMFQGREEEYIRGEYDAYYPDCEPRGFDEMFPTVDACFYEEAPWKGTRLPDHGEVWSLEWDYSIKEKSFEMQVHGIRLPYILRKKVTFKSTNVLRIDYEAENPTGFDMTFLWAAHPMISVEEGSQIILPPECKTAFCIVSESKRLGRYGDHFDLLETIGGRVENDVMLDVRSKEVKDGEKYYIDGKINNGYCGISFPSDESRLIIRFPVESVPYLGIWINEGLWEDTLTVTPEPCTSPYDNINAATAFVGRRVIKGKNCYKWYVEFEVGKEK